MSYLTGQIFILSTAQLMEAPKTIFKYLHFKFSDCVKSYLQ